MESPGYVLFEHAAGYSLFRIKEFEEIGQILPQVEASVSDVSKFASNCKPIAFHWFSNAEAALDNCNAISEGILHSDLLNFLETHVPKEKKAKTKLGIGETKLAAAVSEKLPYIQCSCGQVVQEIIRGVRLHFDKLADVKEHVSFSKAQLGLGHSYSRAKVKFDVNRVDNMIIQAIALLDQLDKDINTFSMRIREWYSYHFPELYKIVPDQYMYCRCAQAIANRKHPKENLEEMLVEICIDEDKVGEILEAGRRSAGIDDISEMDMMNIERFTERVIALGNYRKELQGYLKERMRNVAPNLSELVGDSVGARLISHAGSLTGLAKYPASTVQILGAEKALFRALKTRGNTPKYGLLFHSTFIGRAAAKNKGRISRFLANKCTVASRIDAFADEPVGKYGEFLRQQVEDRLKYFESGKVPKKNLDVMKEATDAAEEERAKLLKKRKKLAKKERRAKEEAQAEPEAAEPVEPEEEIPSKKKKKERTTTIQAEGAAEEEEEEVPTKKKKKRKHTAVTVEEEELKPKKRKAKMEREEKPAEEQNEVEEESKPKKKKKKEPAEVEAEETTSKKKKRKKKQE